MKDDTQETGSRRRYFRYAVFSLAALLVLSLGFAVIPREPPAPPAPPFSEQARAAALADTLSLRAAGLRLNGAGPTPSGPQQGVHERVVTLLTVQARALMLPGGAPAGPSTPASPQSAAPPSAAGFAAALQASASARLKDAETADGGMARLLGGAGIAQLLAAEDVAAAAGVPLPVPAGLPSPAAAETSAEPTAGSPTASPSPGCLVQPTGGTVSVGSALAAAVAAEMELVYAYQAALTRLDDASAVPASDFLAQHLDLGAEAAEMGQESCAAMPPKPAGYALNQQFLTAPAATLRALEAGTLPVYGDLVALGEGGGRVWALSALQSAARRTLHWGGSAGPVPGVVLAESQLPQLPAQDPAPAPSGTAPGR